MYCHLFALWLLSLRCLALSEVNGEKEVSKNVKATIQRIEKLWSPAVPGAMLGNRLARRKNLNTPLHDAVFYGNLVGVKALLDQGADVNVKGNNGQTPLMIAARAGHLDIVNIIISRNASLEIKDELGNAAIHHAVIWENLDVVETLLDHGANIDARGNIKMTPLMFAAGKGYVDLVNLLLSRNAGYKIKDKTHNAAIHHAVMEGNLEVIVALLDHCANVNAKGNKGMTPLMVAIGNGDLSVVSLLISRNALLTIKDEINNGAMHHAAKKGDPRILNALLGHSANEEENRNIAIRPLILAAWKDVKNAAYSCTSKNSSQSKNNINAALHMAALRKHLQVFKTILERASALNCKGENGNTPLILLLTSQPKSPALLKTSIESEILAAVKILVSNGAKLNSKNLINRTALHEAAIRGYTRVVDYLLSHNASFNVEDNFCYTPFHWAANNSEIEVIKTLLEYGDDVNRRGCNNATALHLAIERNDTKLLLFLLSRNADPNVMREDGRTPLDVAFQRALKPFIKLLLDYGAKVEDDSFLGSKVIYGAVANKSLELLRLLLDKAVDFISYPTIILNYAIGTKFLEGTKLLIFYGANIETKDLHGNLPLSSAVRSRRKDLVKLILETGASKVAKEKMNTFLDADSNVKVFSTFANVTEVHRLSALHIAAYYGLTDVLKLLIGYGASLDVRDERDYAPLHYASENGHVDVVKVLLDSGANKSCTDIHRTAPIHLACRRGRFAIAKLLLSVAPVDIDLADDIGYTPLHYAVINGSSEIVKLLLDLGADIEAKSKELRTPLHLAALEGQKEVVQILLNEGAERDASDVDDMTPLHFAARERHPDIVELIIRAKGYEESRNINGSSPLHLVCGSYNTRRNPLPYSKDQELDTIKIILENRGRLNEKDKNLMSELHVASRDGSLACVQQLLQSQKLAGDIWQNYPIHYAALNGHIEIVRMILKKDDQQGRQININHETPLILAAREGHTDVVALLLQGVIDDFRPDIFGRTPLHRSACRGHFAIVKLLLTSMAKRDAEDKWGFTPLNYAASWRGYQDVIGYLSTPQLNITLSYYFNISDPFKQNLADITSFFI